MFYAVADAQLGIPQICPCGSITKELVDEEDTYDYFPGKRYFICKDYERLKRKVYEQEKLLRECQALKEQVRMLHMRVTALERGHSEGIKFNLEHAWRELRHDVKWSSTYLEKDSGKDKRKIVDSDAQGSVTEPQERPIGVKAAKAAGKRKKLGKEEELGQLKEMMVTKKEISNQSLLASLAAKTEPLSDMEEALKIKLMSEML
uniref:Uncharacterized protein n=1 Tax=Brassica oleracea TaxID=3712 RepID=A0A3P6FUV0_BRAOL|nr:unnamed protein product [Brassica oleracea]